MTTLLGTGGKGTNPGSAGQSFDTALLEQAAATNAVAMHNRYQQLGIGVPGQQAPGDQNLVYGGQSTMEKQDLGEIPSESGGISGALGAVLGELQNSQQNNPLFNGQALNTLAEQAGFGAGSSGAGAGGGGGAGPTGPTSTTTDTTTTSV